jgi:hypothetical protein
VIVYVINVMAMQLLRGEAPLEPLTYLALFLAIVGPVIIVVSSIALMFECFRPLSGRIGDVLYFFLWAFLLSAPAATAINGGSGAGSHFDVFAMSFIINAANDQATSDFHAHPEVSIGSSRFDPTRAPWKFRGVTWSAPVIVARLTSAMLALPALLLAWLAFARFDPARMKGGASGSRASGRAAAKRAWRFAPRVMGRARSPPRHPR